MRAARILKHWSVGIVLFGIVVSWTSSDSVLVRLGGVLVSVAVGLLLRVLANIGQVVYEWRQHSMPLLGGIAHNAERLRKSSSKQSVRSILPSPDDEEKTDFMFEEEERCR